MDGYEADDLIGTMVKYLAEKDFLIHIITSDKDMMQLVSDRVYILDTMKNIQIGPNEVEEKLGIPPYLVTDFLALSGDTSDNIPGVAGIGEKTARELIKEFGDIENIYRNIDKIKKQSIRTKLLNGKDSAYMSKALATIKTDCPIEIGEDRIKKGLEDKDQLRKFYRDLEFTSFYNELKKDPDAQIKETKISISELKRDTIGIIPEYIGRFPVDFQI